MSWKNTHANLYDSRHLALNKRLDELLQKNATFDVSNQTETGSAEEQPARDSLTSKNKEVIDYSTTSFTNYILRNAKKT